MLESSLDEINSFSLSGGYDDSAANMRDEFEQHRRVNLDAPEVRWANAPLTSSANTSDSFPKPVEEASKRVASDSTNMSPVESDKAKLTDNFPKRFDNDKITDAFVLSMQTGLPLVVQVGQHWCGHCQHMESNIWPGVEGTAQNKGSMEGKAVFLHLDYDESRKLQGDDAWLAQKLRADVSGFPTHRVYKIGDAGSVKKVAESAGSMSQADLEKFLSSAGVS